MTIKEALSGLTLVHQLLSNKKKRSLRAGPCTLTAKCQKNPSQSWPLHALHQAPEKALSRSISLAPMAARFPVHLAPPIQAVIPPLCLVLTGTDPRAPGQPEDQTSVGEPHAEVRIKPKLNSRDGVTREEDWKSFHQLYKQQIKSPWSARYTLHLWNIWVDNECSHKWKWSISGSYGLWEQTHVGIGPDQSLSGPHRAHSRSRDQPRGRGESLGEVEVGYGSQRVQGHLQQRPQGNIIITINFIMFWFVLLFVLAFCSFDFFNFFCLFVVVVLGFCFVLFCLFFSLLGSLCL